MSNVKENALTNKKHKISDSNIKIVLIQIYTGTFLLPDNTYQPKQRKYIFKKEKNGDVGEQRKNGDKEKTLLQGEYKKLA